MRYYFSMDSFLWWFLGLWLFGALTQRQRIAAWRQNSSTAALKNWVALGLIGFVSMLFFHAVLDLDDGLNIYIGLSAACVWLMLLAGLEAMKRDAAARVQLQRAWEERQRAEAKRQLAQVYRERPRGDAAEDEPEDAVADTDPGADEDEAVWPHNAARVSVEGQTTTIDLTQLFFPQAAAPPETAAEKAPPPGLPPAHVQPASPPRQPRPQPHAVTAAHTINLGVTSRFGSNAPSATAPVSQSVRQTAPMSATPTLANPITHMEHTAAREVPADAINLPVTSMPQTTPVNTAPHSVQAMSAPRVLGPTTLGSSGSFRYQPRLVESKLDPHATKVAPPASDSEAEHS